MNDDKLEIECKCKCSSIVFITNEKRDFINIDVFKNPREQGMQYIPLSLEKESVKKLLEYLESLNLD